MLNSNFIYPGNFNQHAIPHFNQGKANPRGGMQTTCMFPVNTCELIMSMQIIVVGAGLAGLGAAISCLLAGHDVQILEAAVEIREVGAGIQVLPNSSRIL